MKVVPIPSADRERREAVVRLLRDTADRLESGEILHVVGIIDNTDGTYTNFRTRHVGRHEMIGILHEAMTRMGEHPDVSD